MARKIIKKFLPTENILHKYPLLDRLFGPILGRQDLWHINRRSVSRAFAVGLFCTFIPLPLQMIVATFFAIISRANITISIILVWITNPFTITPIFYFCYKIGTLLLNTPSEDFYFDASWEWLQSGLLATWKPFLLGCFVVGTTAAILGYISIRLYWRYYVISYWRKRSLAKE